MYAIVQASLHFLCCITATRVVAPPMMPINYQTADMMNLCPEFGKEWERPLSELERTYGPEPLCCARLGYRVRWFFSRRSRRCELGKTLSIAHCGSGVHCAEGD